MKRGKLRARVLAAVCVAGTVLGACGFTRTLVFTSEQLQQKLDARFPVSKEAYRLTTTLSDPVVQLEEGTDRIGLDVTVAVEHPGVRILGKELVGAGRADGRFGLTGQVQYVPEEGAFFFTNPVIHRMETEQIPDRFADRVVRVVGELLGAYLSRAPIYRLKDDTLKKKATRLLLRSVVVKEGKLRVKVGVGGS